MRVRGIALLRAAGRVRHLTRHCRDAPVTRAGVLLADYYGGPTKEEMGFGPADAAAHRSIQSELFGQAMGGLELPAPEIGI